MQTVQKGAKRAKKTATTTDTPLASRRRRRAAGEAAPARAVPHTDRTTPPHTRIVGAKWAPVQKRARALFDAVKRESRRVRDVRLSSLARGLETLCEVIDRVADGDDAVVDIGAHRSNLGGDRDVAAHFRFAFIAYKQLFTPEERAEIYEAHHAKEREIFARRLAKGATS